VPDAALLPAQIANPLTFGGSDLPWGALLTSAGAQLILGTGALAYRRRVRSVQTEAVPDSAAAMT
jgi:hypothetical protein